LEVLIATFINELTALDVDIAATFQQDDVWAAAAARLQTIPGIGLIANAWLLPATLNFTIGATPEALTAYAGLVPYPWESGESPG
jgi:transposase